MISENRIPTHLDAVLLEDILKPLGITQVAFAAHVMRPDKHARRR